MSKKSAIVITVYDLDTSDQLFDFLSAMQERYFEWKVVHKEHGKTVFKESYLEYVPGRLVNLDNEEEQP